MSMLYIDYLLVLWGFLRGLLLLKKNCFVFEVDLLFECLVFYLVFHIESLFSPFRTSPLFCCRIHTFIVSLLRLLLVMSSMFLFLECSMMSVERFYLYRFYSFSCFF